MTILAIDTTGRGCSVALRHGERSASKTYVRAADIGRGHAEIVVTQLEDLGRQAEIEFHSITSILVSVGPGSFTGVRVGVSLARGLALANDADLFGAYSTELIGTATETLLNSKEGDAVKSLTDGQRFMAVIDAGRQEFYGQIFSRDGCSMNAIGDPLTVRHEMAGGFLLDNSIEGVVGPGAIAYLEVAREKTNDANIFAYDLSTNAVDLFDVRADRYITGLDVKPFYLRQADAKPQLHKALARRST